MMTIQKMIIGLKKKWSSPRVRQNLALDVPFWHSTTVMHKDNSRVTELFRLLGVTVEGGICGMTWH
jgi:hypothetical protein